MLVVTVLPTPTTPTATVGVVGRYRSRMTTWATPPAGIVPAGSPLYHTGSPAFKMSCGGVPQ